MVLSFFFPGALILQIAAPDGAKRRPCPGQDSADVRTRPFAADASQHSRYGYKAMLHTAGISVGAHDLALCVDVVDASIRGAGNIDGDESAPA